MKILFQGDSITDTGRDRGNLRSLGSGYVRVLNGLLKSKASEVPMACINKGISGNRVVDLLGRWQEDCLDLQPDIVSILIGVNDVWRRYDANDPTSCEDFEAGYGHLLSQVKEKTDAKIVMLEPFLLHTPEDRLAWRDDLDPKIEAVNRLAKTFADVFVPFDGIFTEVAKMKGPEYWAADGVHPTPAGHQLIAERWLESVSEAGLI